MPKEPSSNQVSENQGKILENGKIECTLCGNIYKSAGFHNHKNSKVCARKYRWKTRIEEINQRFDKLNNSGKTPVTKTISNALKYRGLEDIAGLEFAETDFYLDHTAEEGSDEEFKTFQRPWIYDWVANGYRYYVRASNWESPNPMYEELMQVKNAEDYEAAYNMTMLKWLDL